MSLESEKLQQIPNIWGGVGALGLNLAAPGCSMYSLQRVEQVDHWRCAVHEVIFWSPHSSLAWCMVQAFHPFLHSATLWPSTGYNNIALCLVPMGIRENYLLCVYPLMIRLMEKQQGTFPSWQNLFSVCNPSIHSLLVLRALHSLWRCPHCPLPLDRQWPMDRLLKQFKKI